MAMDVRNKLEEHARELSDIIRLIEDAIGHAAAGWSGEASEVYLSCMREAGEFVSAMVDRVEMLKHKVNVPIAI